MRNKVAIFLIFLFTIISPISIKAKNLELENNELKQVLKDYFSAYLEVQKNLDIVNNESISDESELNEFFKIHSQVTIDTYTKTGEITSWYNIDIKINTIEENENFFKVDVDNIVNLKYENTDFESSYIENHIIFLNKDLKIINDIFEVDMNAKEVEESTTTMIRGGSQNNYIENKINKLKNKQENIDSYFSNENNENIEDKEQNIITPSTRAFYDGRRAAQWALNNVYSSGDYPADCTNFVSKAINAGGIPKDNTWYLHSNAWIRVLELRNWLINKRYGTQYSDYRYALVGDIIQYYNPSYGNWRHTVIVTGRDNWNYYPYVSAHSNAKYNVSASYYYPNGTNYTQYRVIDVHG